MADTIEAPPTTKGNYALLHELTWPEVLTSKRSVSNRSGYLVAGPDRRGANALAHPHLWRMWQHDVQAAETVPPAVADYFVRTRHLAAPPKEGMDIEVYGSNPPANAGPIAFDENEFGVSDPLSKEGTTPMLDLLELTPDASGAFAVPASTKKHPNPPRFATSFSGMESFLQCPRKWAAEKFYKTVPYEEGPAAAEGNRGHKTAENYLLNAIHNGKLPVDEVLLQKVKRYCDFFLSSGATLHVEKEMCCTKDLRICDWKDWNNVWFRGKGDLIAIKNRKLTVADWKFGKIKDDPFQIEVMIALADLHFGDLFDVADGKLIFVKEPDPKKAMVGLPAPVDKAGIRKIWEKIFTITNRMEQAWQSEVFRMQTNGLCKNYCGDKSCPNNGRR